MIMTFLVQVTSMYDMWMKSILTMDAKKMDTTQLVCLRTLAIMSFSTQMLIKCVSYSTVLLKYRSPSISLTLVHRSRRLVRFKK
jgi:hypothetical protein